MRYRPVFGGRLFISFVFAMFGVFTALFLLEAIRAEDGPPDAFFVLWLAGLVWNSYWWLFRIAAELVLEAGQLRASSPLRTRTVALSALVEVRPMRLSSQVVVIELPGERPILTIAAKGLREFTDELVRQHPDLPVRLGWHAQRAERMPGWSRTKRR